MKTNTIIDKLARTIERVELGKGGEPLPFVYAEDGLRNIILDQLQPPFAACVPIESGVVNDERGQFHERLTLSVVFGDTMCQSVPEYDARENERIIDECKRRAFKWLALLTPTKELRLISVNGSLRVYMEEDAYITGFAVNVTLEEIESVGKCSV